MAGTSSAVRREFVPVSDQSDGLFDLANGSGRSGAGLAGVKRSFWWLSFCRTGLFPSFNLRNVSALMANGVDVTLRHRFAVR